MSQVITEVAEWGFEVNQDKEHIQFVKLLLDPSQQLPEYVSRRDLEARLSGAHKTAVQAAADYLINLKQHVLEQIEERFGQQLLAATQFEFVITVPAVWSDAAKDATMKAAQLAGLNENDKLSMITEPEAAALCALKTVTGVSAEENDIWIVCDAGGGTPNRTGAFDKKHADLTLAYRYCGPYFLPDQVNITTIHRRSRLRRRRCLR